MKFGPIKPLGVTLLTTTRCTAACDNCCFGCNPKQGRSMTYEEMKDYVDRSLEAYPDTISRLDLTGGECMLLGKDIDKIFAYAKSKGLKCSMVSNAFWATDYEKAYRTLKRLKRNGLTYVSFSTGEDHDKYVPWRNVRNAAIASALLGIDTELRIENNLWRSEIVNELNSDTEISDMVRQGKLKMSHSPWMRYNNKGKKPRSFKMELRNIDKRSCMSLFRDVIINPYGEVYACCGIGVCHIPQMRLGNIHQESIKAIYERAFDDFLKIWLYIDGPQAVLEFVKKKTNQKFQWHTTHHCDICRTIFTDKSILPLIRDNFFEAAYFPLMTYNGIAKLRNEVRTKR